MVAIIIQDFGGRLPRRAARLIPDNFAQIAENVKLIYGDLRGYNDFTLMNEFPTGTLPKRVWKVKNTAQTAEAWYGSTDPYAELIKSPIVNDSFDRYYLFQKSQPPKVLTFSDIEANAPAQPLAFTQPITPAVLTPVGGTGSIYSTRVYTYTYVTEWGEESRIAPVTAVEGRTDLTSITVTIIPGPPPPTISGRSIQFIRIYRTVTGTQGGQLYYVDDVPYVASGITYSDTNADLVVALNEPLNASDHDPPPTGIWGARIMSNGSIVAFKDRDIYFSIPYLPHAWPEDWRLTVPDLIVGLEVSGQNIMVMTQGSPVLLYGTYPDVMGMLKYSFPEPCIAYGSIVAAPEGVYYAAYSGLVLFTSTGTNNITNQMISRDMWKTEYLDFDTRAERMDTRYIASKTDSKGYVIDGQEERIALVDLVGWVTIGDISSDGFTGDTLAISFDAVYAFDNPEGIEIDYRWKSKQFVMAKPVNMGALMLHLEERETEWLPSTILNPAYDYPPDINKRTQMLVRVWADERLVFEQAVSDREQCRLPSDFMATVWEIEVQGQCRVERIGLAETGRELAQI
jgi:hypothetical protein